MSLWDFRSSWHVFIHEIQGHLAGLLQCCWDAVKTSRSYSCVMSIRAIVRYVVDAECHDAYILSVFELEVHKKCYFMVFLILSYARAHASELMTNGWMNEIIVTLPQWTVTGYSLYKENVADYRFFNIMCISPSGRPGTAFFRATFILYVMRILALILAWKCVAG